MSDRRASEREQLWCASERVNGGLSRSSIETRGGVRGSERRGGKESRVDKTVERGNTDSIAVDSS